MSEAIKKTGQVTIPTNLDIVPETIEILKRWGADAIRDCDGTEFPEELTKVGAKIYSTYYTTRKDNVWAKANPDEVQQCYIMTGFHTATERELSIALMKVYLFLNSIPGCSEIKVSSSSIVLLQKSPPSMTRLR